MAKKDSNFKIKLDLFWPCLLLWVLAFWGEPDLLDAMIHALMN